MSQFDNPTRDKGGNSPRKKGSSSASGKGTQPPSKEEFARLVIDAIRKAGEKAELRYEPEAFRLVSEGNTTWIFNLDNCYREYCAPGADRKGLLANAANTWFAQQQTVADTFEGARPHLLPAVRSRSYFELLRLSFQAQGTEYPGHPYRTLAEHLAVGVVYEFPASRLQVGHDHLSDWKVSFDEALEVALANLRAISDRPFAGGDRGVWFSPYGDNHDSARLLLTEQVRGCKVQGDIVATAPNRDTLLLTGSEDLAGLAVVAKMTEEEENKPRFISGLAVRLSAEGWVPFLPPAGHPLHGQFRLLALRSLGQDYASQKESLEQLHKRTGEDIFVASFSAVKKDTGEVRSYCVWSEGVDSLLPRTDDVALVGAPAKGKEKGEIVGLFPWERVRQVAGERMEPLGWYPERYRVRSFPTEEQRGALGGG